MRSCMNCGNFSCKADYKSDHVICKYYIDDKSESAFTNDELKDLLVLTRGISSISGDVGRADRLRNKIMNMIGCV